MENLDDGLEVAKSGKRQQKRKAGGGLTLGGFVLAEGGAEPREAQERGFHLDIEAGREDVRCWR